MQIYQSKVRIKTPEPYDPTFVDQGVNAIKQALKQQQQRDLKQRNSDATNEMLNIETSISNKLVDIEKQVGTDGQINGVSYPDIVAQIEVEKYKGFVPPPELKDQYNIQRAKYQASRAKKSHEFYSAIRAKKATTDLKKTYGDIAILANRETATENLEKIKLLVDSANISATHKSALLTSMTQGHNNQMYRNDINNPSNNVKRLEFQYDEFKKNIFSVGLENHKTIDKLFISKIKTKKIANVAFDKAQKKYQREQIIELFKMHRNIDITTKDEFDFKPYINDREYTPAQREDFKHFENIQKPLRYLSINMAAGYSAEIDEVRAKLERQLVDEKSSTFTKDNTKQKLDYINLLRSQFEVKIRQPGGIDFIIAQVNKGDNPDIMDGAERESAEWVGKANSMMNRLGVSEGNRNLLTRETREELVTDPFDTIKRVLATMNQKNWDDVSRRDAIKEMTKVTGLPKGMTILLRQDSVKGIRALKNYKNNKELYKKSDPLIKFDTDIIFKSSTDSTREKLRLSGLPVEDLLRFDSAIKIQTLSTWETTGGDINGTFGFGKTHDIDNVFENTYREIVNKDFIFSSDEINGGHLRFDASKVPQDLADKYAKAVDYIINEPEILDEFIIWNAIGDIGEDNGYGYDKDEIYDLIVDAKIISINDNSEFAIVSNGIVIPTQPITWQHAKELYDKRVQAVPTIKLNL